MTALDSAFGDFDSACVKVDFVELPSKHRERMEETLRIRAIQFCILMREFFGEEMTRRILTNAMDQLAETATDS